MSTVRAIAFFYIYSSRKASRLAQLVFLVQNLAGAILSLCKMECLQYLSSLGKFSKNMFGGKQRGKQLFLLLGISTQTKDLSYVTLWRHTVRIPF